MRVFAFQIGSGGGSLFYRGRAYPFIIGGLGVGGTESSAMIDVYGDVYHLPDIAAFPGGYAQGPTFGGLGGGGLWLQNRDNVIMHLFAKRPGYMLNVGGDIVAITPVQ